MRLLTGWTLAVSLVAASPALAQSYAEQVDLARSLYAEQRYEESARNYVEAFRIETGSSRDHYDAACSWALAGDHDAALAALAQAVELGYRNLRWLTTDEDLAALHEDARWEEIVAACRTAHEAYLESINLEMYELFQADQDDRQGNIDWSEVAPRDEARRTRAWEMVDAGLLKAPDDFIHAAFIFQHGGDSTSYAMANELAMKAVALDSTNLRARWIAAASKDRYLMSVGKPQIYGTQYQTDENGQWTQAPYDTTAVTDEERARWGVRSRAQQRTQLRSMNQ